MFRSAVSPRAAPQSNVRQPSSQLASAAASVLGAQNFARAASVSSFNLHKISHRVSRPSPGRLEFGAVFLLSLPVVLSVGSFLLFNQVKVIKSRRRLIALFLPLSSNCRRALLKSPALLYLVVSLPQISVASSSLSRRLHLPYKRFLSLVGAALLSIPFARLSNFRVWGSRFLSVVSHKIARLSATSHQRSAYVVLVCSSRYFPTSLRTSCSFGRQLL